MHRGHRSLQLLLPIPLHRSFSFPFPIPSVPICPRMTTLKRMREGGMDLGQDHCQCGGGEGERTCLWRCGSLKIAFGASCHLVTAEVGFYPVPRITYYTGYRQQPLPRYYLFIMLQLNLCRINLRNQPSPNTCSRKHQARGNRLSVHSPARRES